LSNRDHQAQPFKLYRIIFDQFTSNKLTVKLTIRPIQGKLWRVSGREYDLDDNIRVNRYSCGCQVELEITCRPGTIIAFLGYQQVIDWEEKFLNNKNAFNAHEIAILDDCDCTCEHEGGSYRLRVK
jgi:hypothetical protein